MLELLNLQSYNTNELLTHIRNVTKELDRRIVGEQEKPKVKPQNPLIEKAINDIEKLKSGRYYVTKDGRHCTAEFHVNKLKGTITVLLKGCTSGKIWAKGISKCAPNDQFNENIGKAVALYRALEKRIPEQYIY